MDFRPSQDDRPSTTTTRLYTMAERRVPSGVRKRMRKGTQSCTECRRRKIRCSFRPGDDICSPCSNRGSHCIDQQIGNYAADHTRIEQPDQTSNSSREEFRDINGADSHAPIISVLNDADLLWPTSSDEMQRPPTFANVQSKHRASRPSDGQVKSVCESLRSALPPYDTMMSALSKNGAWWASFRLKTSAIYQAPIVGLVEFAAHTYTSSNPAELGMLVTAYARTAEDAHHLYALVYTLIISEFAYLATTEGLECLILLAKSYTDIGQPRRAWLMWRRGMDIAQLMGLYRADSAAQQKIWWAIYHGDRFTSMLLGLPHGFSDAYYSDVDIKSEHMFILRCAIIAGKTIDRNIALAKPSFAKTMDLDEQMDAISASMPQEWWSIPDELPNPGLELNHLTERLLQQFFFFHIRLYLHLPFIAKSTHPPYDICRLACIESSRQMLRIFLVLRTEIQGASIFECKTSDFVGFTAAVALLVGLSEMHGLRDAKEDWRLIASAEAIFQREATDNGCRISSQCQKAIRMLSSAHEDLQVKSHEFRIPYFGTVVQGRARRSAQISREQPPLSTPLVPTSDFVAEDQIVWPDSLEIEYMGYDLNNPIEGMHFMDNVDDELSLWLDTARIWTSSFCFSSFSENCGQRGQANYAAANTFLDAFAQYRHGQALPASVLDIGAVLDAGYVSENIDIRNRLIASGFHGLHEQDLLDSLHLVITRSAPPATSPLGNYTNLGQVGIGFRSPQPIALPTNRIIWKRDPRMSLYRNFEEVSEVATTSKNEALKNFLSDARIDPYLLDSEASVNFLAREIGLHLFSFLMKPSDELDTNLSLTAVGLDSLIAIEMRNWWKQSLGFDVTILEILAAGTIVGLGALAARRLKVKFEPEAQISLSTESKANLAMEAP
ncbi:hypothetical protein V502_04850 [Pseudogymnoascus sp. VKM F-4520 (FW-2644)]|nr:hypothetical protein V502_04850 [Pseudogymnoascus sp. VKM F-4520 (FW-2644)]